MTEDVLLASVPAAGIVDLRGVQASSSYDDGVLSEEASQTNTQGFLVNDGSGTVAYTPAFDAPATFGPGVLPPSPALVVVGTDLFCRFVGLAGETIFHQVVWEAYAP